MLFWLINSPIIRLTEKCLTESVSGYFTDFPKENTSFSELSAWVY